MKKYIAITILLTLVLFTRCTVPVVKQGQPAEYAHALTIVMHEPYLELFPAVLHPESASFSEYFNVDLAANEHALFTRQLRVAGVNVITVRELLLEGTIDENGYPVEGNALKRLREFAADFITYDMDIPVQAGEPSGVGTTAAANVANGTETVNAASRAVNAALAAKTAKEEAIKRYKKEVIDRANPHDLVRIILMRPTITIRRSSDGKELPAQYSVNPSVNLFSMRDLMISTAKGVIVGRMSDTSNEAGYRIAEFCLDKMGLTPVGRIAGENSLLAGGDFIPFGRNAFIAKGGMTNKEGVNELMENDWLGCDSLIIVKGAHPQMGRTLDNYFNVIDRDLATLCERSYNASPDSTYYLTADVYVREENTYRKIAESESFVRYVEDRLGMKIIPVSEEDERTYAGHYLTIAPRRIIAVSGQSENFKAALSVQQVDVTWMPLDNVIKGYGTPHSMTQVLGRQRMTF